MLWIVITHITLTSNLESLIRRATASVLTVSQCDASGSRGSSSGSLGAVGSEGYYWLSSSESDTSAYLLNFYPGGVRPQYSHRRCNGFSVQIFIFNETLHINVTAIVITVIVLSALLVITVTIGCLALTTNVKHVVSTSNLTTLLRRATALKVTVTQCD